MSLVTCSACGKQISDEASACPNCGQPNKNKRITCPNCGSTNCEKISMGSKVVAGAMFGLFAMGKISKTWQCSDCKFKW